MSDADQLAAVAATEVDRMRRLAALGNHGTAGPDNAVPSFSSNPPVSPRWLGGWWSEARQHPAHPGRVGGPIGPFAIVVHTTDMLPEEWSALVHAWTDRASDGACAHFLIGRCEDDGVIQFAPITRNANHAGGPTHGSFVAAGRSWHPNLVTVGIEIHCAGGVRLIDGKWRLVEDGKAHGAPLPDIDVIQDPQRPGRGWHKVTEYQYEQLAALRADLEAALAPLPVGCITTTQKEQPARRAKSARCVGHQDLDPYARADPWPPTYERVLQR